MKKLNVAEDSELFQEHTHCPPPSTGEEEEDEVASDESSMMIAEQVPVVTVPQSSEQVQRASTSSEQLPLPSEQPTPSSKSTEDVIGNKEKV